MQHPIAQPTILQRQFDDPKIALELFRRYLVDVVNVLNSATQGVGAPLASATVLKPTNAIHHVTGTATIQTITVPVGFTGPLFLLSDNGFSLTTGGNIATAATVGIGTEAMLVFDAVNWYPIVGSASVPPSNVIIVISVSSNTTLFALSVPETVILADPTSFSFTVAIPPAISSANKIMYVKNVATNGNTVTVQGNGAELIDGLNTQVVLPGSDMDIACNGTAWFIL